MSNKAASTSQQLFAKVLKQGSLLIGLISIVGGAIGYAVASTDGLLSALVGGAMALVFVSLTALTVWLGGKLSLGGFFGVVLGGWLLKLVGFVVTIAVLKDAEFIVGPVLFFTIVASVLGSLAIDALAVLRSRIPVVEQ